MVRVLLLTGCRASEVLTMRVGDTLDRSTSVWTYTPRWHKNHWRGQQQVVYLGPQAQVIISEFLKADPDAFLFCPREFVEAACSPGRAAVKRTPSETARAST